MLKKAHAPVLKAGSSIKSGGFGPGVPPLPIPNREVKPGRADGTAPQCGRVGRRLLSGALRTIMWRAPFFCPSFCVPLQRPGGASRQLLRVGQAAFGSAGAAGAVPLDCGEPLRMRQRHSCHQG